MGEFIISNAINIWALTKMSYRCVCYTNIYNLFINKEAHKYLYWSWLSSYMIKS